MPPGKPAPTSLSEEVVIHDQPEPIKERVLDSRKVPGYRRWRKGPVMKQRRQEPKPKGIDRTEIGREATNA